MMQARAVPGRVDQVQEMRTSFLEGLGCQFVSDSLLHRGAGNPYLLLDGDDEVGYGVVLNRYDPGHIHEFYLNRDYDLHYAEALAQSSGATHVRAQTNMPLMLQVACDLTSSLEVEYVLFEDHEQSPLQAPMEGIRFAEVFDVEPNHPDSRYFSLVVNDQVAVKGGYLGHYNPPYVDVYMDLQQEMRGKGLGSYFVQEVRRQALQRGKKPAARCGIDNLASRRTLMRGGFRPCGHLVFGPMRSLPPLRSV